MTNNLKVGKKPDTDKRRRLVMWGKNKNEGRMAYPVSIPEEQTCFLISLKTQASLTNVTVSTVVSEPYSVFRLVHFDS